MIDRRPALIVRCAEVDDVLSALAFARSQGLLVAVRGGGHSVAGHGVCDSGMVIDLSQMRGIRVDPLSRTARAQPGLTWGDFDQATQAFGLAVPGGLISTTGIAGFTLGGGMGWLSRKYGVASDNLISADVVTADGRLLVASPKENEDLFWGIRGGGGNFGIVTSFEYRLHLVGPTVLAGLLVYPGGRAREVLGFLRDLMGSAPEDLLALAVLRVAPPAPFLPAHVHGTPVIILGCCYAGPIEEGERALRGVRKLGEPLANTIAPRSYTQLQSMLDATQAPGFHNYWKAEYLEGLTNEAIDRIVDCASTMSSPLSDVKVIPLGGALEDVAENSSAFAHRGLPLIVNINSRWVNPVESERHVAWTRGFWSAIKAFSAGGVYVNFLGSEGEDRVRGAYGPAKYRRLVELKDRFDPTNFFRLNQNIRPTARLDLSSS
jgi:FAD/FMN-containing dehydrogenase